MITLVRWALACILALVWAQAAAPLPASPTSLLTSWTPPLSTRGRYIVDSTGARFHLRGGNLHGASGTYLGRGRYDDASNHHAGEVAYQTILCLDRKPLDELIDDILALGINTIRLPWSNEMIHTQTYVPDRALTANPQLRNRTPLEVFDEVVKALTRKGLAVILNNHTVKSIWCCGLDQNARWNEAQSTEQWIEDWVLMVRRYAGNPRVVGAALYNEVRRDLLHDPTWGAPTDGGNPEHDWYSASLLAATRIQREASPNILIVIEGINWVGIPIDPFPHYRPELSPVAHLSHALPYPDKLVYSAHFYAYTGPNATGAGGNDPTYGELSPSKLRSVFHALAGYVATPPTAPQQHYTAPVWISEFGVGGRNDYSQIDRRWWGNFTQILVDEGLDFAVWPLLGWQERGQGDLWALNAYDAKGGRLSILDEGDWRLKGWRKLVDGSQRRDEVKAAETWRMLAPDWGSQQQSNWLVTHKPPQPGSHTASCPDGLRLQGLSHTSHPRGLCTDAHFGRGLWDPSDPKAELIVVHPEHTVLRWGRYDGANWAPGYDKLQCPPRSFLVGYSYSPSSSKSSSAVCAPIVAGSTDPGLAVRRTVWFDKSSNAAGTAHGVFAEGEGALMGACDEDELAVGYAFAARGKEAGRPAALLCESYDGRETQRRARAHDFRVRVGAVFRLILGGARSAAGFAGLP